MIYINRELWSFAYRLYQAYAKMLQESKREAAPALFVALCREIECYKDDPEAWALLSGVYSMLEELARKLFTKQFFCE